MNKRAVILKHPAHKQIITQENNATENVVEVRQIAKAEQLQSLLTGLKSPVSSNQNNQYDNNNNNTSSSVAAYNTRAEL